MKKIRRQIARQLIRLADYLDPPLFIRTGSKHAPQLTIGKITGAAQQMGRVIEVDGQFLVDFRYEE